MNRPQADAAVVTHDIAAELRPRRLDAAIAALADRQHGVVSRDQLIALGLGRGAIAHRVERGRLHPLHRGVFAVGHRVLSKHARWLAAVLAIGPGAALSHQSAAALWGMRGTSRARTDVTVNRTRRPRMTIHIHEATLPADELTITRGIPVTTPARTLLDLAAVVGPQTLERAIDEAEVLRLTSPLSLNDLIDRHRGRPGIPAIQRILDAGFVGATITRNDLEDLFRSVLDEAGLPRPAFNADLQLGDGWIQPDCMWRQERVIVELDGFESHGTRAAFESDRARDRALQVAGWRVIRVTWSQLHERPAAVVSQLRVLLHEHAGP